MQLIAILLFFCFIMLCIFENFYKAIKYILIIIISLIIIHFINIDNINDDLDLKKSICNNTNYYILCSILNLTPYIIWTIKCLCIIYVINKLINIFIHI